MNPQQPFQPTPPTEPQQPIAPPAYQPQQPVGPVRPVVTEPQPQATVAPISSDQPARKSHKKIGLILVIAPTVLIILAVAFAVISGMMASPQSGDDLFGDPTPLGRTLNVLSYIFGALGFITWLPALIIGIVLLVKKK